MKVGQARQSQTYIKSKPIHLPHLKSISQRLQRKVRKTTFLQRAKTPVKVSQA